jgi:hypothetical protein
MIEQSVIGGASAIPPDTARGGRRTSVDMNAAAARTSACAFTPHPHYLLPAYFHGRNLAESYYLAIPGLSWQNIVVGDPLCKLE